MLSEGESAPSFTLPAVVDNDQTTITLDEKLGEHIIILIFYPGDFATEQEARQPVPVEFDLFTMQTGLKVLGISGDSIFSHRRFASEHSLQLPLLSDVDGTVSELYGVAVEDSSCGYQSNRAVFVLDQTGTVEHRWVADSLDDYPDVAPIREAAVSIGDNETAMGSYCDGFTAYETGAETFQRALQLYEKHDWLASQSEFIDAQETLSQATEAFETATWFAVDDAAHSYYIVAAEYGELLGRAAEWFTEAAEAFAAGKGRTAESLQADATQQLAEADELPEPLNPSEFPPTEPLDHSTVKSTSLLDNDGTADLGNADISQPTEMAVDQSGEGIVDEEELAEITAELAEQSHETNTQSSAGHGSGTATEPDSTGQSDTDSLPADESVELELTDPTESNGNGSSDEPDGPEQSRG